MEEENAPPKPLPRRLLKAGEGAVPEGAAKKPIPLPRSKNNRPKENRSSTGHSFSWDSVSKQISDNIGEKLHESENYVREVKQIAGDKLDWTIKGSKIAKQKIQDSVRKSTRSVRSKVTKSFIENKNTTTSKLHSQETGGGCLRKEKGNKSNVLTVPHQDRCVSMPVADIALFDSIQFHSPLVEQNQYDCKDIASDSSGSTLNLPRSPHRYGPNISPSGSEVSTNCSLPADRPQFHGELYVEDQTYDTPRSSTVLAPSSASSDVSPTVSITGVSVNNIYNPIYEVNEDTIPKTINDNQHNILLLPQIKTIVKTPYENWDVNSRKNVEVKPIFQPRQSIMLEFDPLHSGNASDSSGRSSSLLEPVLPADSGNYTSLEECITEENLSDDSDGEFWTGSISYLCPPTPPPRFDSLSADPSESDNVSITTKITKSSTSLAQTEWFIDSETEATDSSSKPAESTAFNRTSSVMGKFSSMLKIVPDSALYLKKKIDLGMHSEGIPSRLLLPVNPVHHRGMMVRFLPGGIEELFKNFPLRTCFLADHKLTFYQDNSSSNQVKDTYNMKNFFSIQIILSHKFNYDGELHCFQINFSSLGTFNIQQRSIIFGVANESERNMWIRRIVEMYTGVFPLKYIIKLTRFGWCYLKEGVSGSWDAAWILLKERCLHFYTSQDSNVRTLDLRKARCVVLQAVEEKKLGGNEGQHLLLDFPDSTFYLRMGALKETRLWHRILKAVACNNGSSIHHQQLTKDDIPTIVDKCINFIYTQGSLSEGIYRKAGSSSEVSSLLAAFRKDAWAVQLSARTNSEHDVANALKRFFRDLPESLLTPSLHSALCSVTDLPKEEKVKSYQDLIRNLNPISQNTLKKLLGHLHFISSLSDVNCMTPTNLATVWGPTLLMSPKSAEGTWVHKENEVVLEMIELYMAIYEPSEKDIEKESKMLKVLKQCQLVSNPIQKRSGDLHVWIYLKEKQAGNCINVVLAPGKSSGEVCTELSGKMKLEAHLLHVEEVICNDSMSRPLHHTELLFDVVLRWGYWDDVDRKDNYLVVKENSLLREVEAVRGILLPNSPVKVKQEIKYASEKNKSFNLCKTEITEDSLTCFKEKPITVVLGNWKIQDIRWYIGHESKRNPHCKWSLTFIQKYNKALRSKEKPWFGCTIAGASKDNMLQLVRALLQAEFPGDLLPTPQLVVP